MKSQLLIIGAGPGGYTAAFHAAKLGMKVTLVDTSENPGGVCLHRGCIPSKALLHVAKILTDVQDARRLGIEFGTPDINLEKIRAWKDGVVSKLTAGLQFLCKQHKVMFLRGKAAFTGSTSARVIKEDGSGEEISFEHAIIATGSEPIPLPFAPISPRVLDSTTALSIKEIPSRLLVIGGGYIGLELGTVYAALGSSVSVVEMTSSLLDGIDPDLIHVLERRLKNTFAGIHLGTRVTGLDESDDGMTVTMEDADGKVSKEKYDQVLTAIGRKPRTHDLGLINTKVQIDEKGFVQVNQKRRTSDPVIYAIGDITGYPLLAHKAMAEAPVAVETILGKDILFDPKTIPSVVYTDPEIAYCGLSEAQALKQNRPIKIGKLPWTASGKAAVINRTDGLTKIIVDEQTEKILGVGIVGTGAGELIAEAVAALSTGLEVSDWRCMIHAHPTLSETIPGALSNLI